MWRSSHQLILIQALKVTFKALQFQKMGDISWFVCQIMQLMFLIWKALHHLYFPSKEFFIPRQYIFISFFRSLCKSHNVDALYYLKCFFERNNGEQYSFIVVLSPGNVFR